MSISNFIVFLLNPRCPLRPPLHGTGITQLTCFVLITHGKSVVPKPTPEKAMQCAELSHMKNTFLCSVST